MSEGIIYGNLSPSGRLPAPAVEHVHELVGPAVEAAAAEQVPLIAEAAVGDAVAPYVAQVQAIRDDVQEISGLTGEDSAVAFLVADPASDTRAALDGLAGDRTVTPRPGQGVNIKSGSPVNSVEGGTANTILGGGTTGNPIIITGGNEAGTSGSYRVITGGYDHVIDSTGVGADVIGGGAHHRITGQATHGTIAGGSYNEITAGDYGTVSGGTQNEITAAGATISGGRTNTATGQDSAIAGGVGNTASGQNDVIAGGINNMANGPGATIGGGNGNRSYGRNSYIGSGDGNQLGEEGTSRGDYAYVGGGFRNSLGTLASARYSTIPGGRECSVQHEYSTASGYHAVSRLPGAEVRASGSFATPGDAQTERLTLRRQTTDATPTVLGWNGLAAPPTIPVNATYLLEGTVVARRTDQAGSNRAWKISGMFVRDSGGARVIDPTITPLGAEGEATAWDVTLTAGGSTINVNGVGAIGHTVRWLAQVTLAELAQN